MGEKICIIYLSQMFAASFPLAPALALVFNIIDFKIDSKRLLRWTRRPTPYRDNDIGEFKSTVLIYSFSFSHHMSQ